MPFGAPADPFPKTSPASRYCLPFFRIGGSVFWGSGFGRMDRTGRNDQESTHQESVQQQFWNIAQSMQDQHKIEPKSTPHRAKIDPTSTPNGAKIDPKWSQKWSQNRDGCWEAFGEHPGGSRGCPGAVLGRPGASLGPSWRLLGASWAVLGASWSLLGASWRRLGASWGRLWAVLGRPGGVLGESWSLLGRPGAVLGVVFGGPWPMPFSEPFRNPFLNHVGTIWSPSWRAETIKSIGGVLKIKVFGSSRPTSFRKRFGSDCEPLSTPK